ncbi:hypothetical protein EMN47_17575 [Prolixibacteraceae bacterium JC049]|nr:hypothetical protein [Prolixibacteraceae bacterium JC049]
MSEKYENSQSQLLILADFSDGKWHAASFAMQFLFKEKSSISLLQTYQKPGFGHFMMRKLNHHLKAVSIHELSALKAKLLTKFKIAKQKVKTISLEGELVTVLNYGQLIKRSYYVVLSTFNSFVDSCSRQNRCLDKIINTANNPLFILPKNFEEGVNSKILFVGNPEIIPSRQLCNQILEICSKTKSKLEILFVRIKQKQKIDGEMENYYNRCFKNIGYSINYIEGKTKCKGIKKYLNNIDRDLIIIQNN